MTQKPLYNNAVLIDGYKTMVIYGDSRSGNCYKIKLLLAFLAKDYQWQEIDIMQSQTKTASFLAMNPMAQVPVMCLSDGRCLTESNAILQFLGRNTNFYPNDDWLQAKIAQWLFFEQYSHEPYIAVARFINKYLGLPEKRLEEYQSKQAGGHKALLQMEQQLKGNDFFVGKQITIADIALYAYSHVADEGGFDLSIYPFIKQWFERIQGQKNYIEIG